MKGTLITFEGIDGSGKSTACEQLCRQLSSENLQVCLIDPKRPKIADPYIAKHLAGLAAILWERGAIEPRRLLNDRHWVFLSSAWFQVIDEHLVRPALAEYDVVVLDSWFHKLLGRFRLKGPFVFDLAANCYSTLTRPDMVCLLDIAPVVAADRKREFGYSETGNFDGLSGVTRDNFIAYQTRVRESLLAFAEHDHWERLAIETISAEEVARCIVAALAARRRS